MDQLELDRDMQIELGSKPVRYFENAMYRHWNPSEIDLSKDPERIVGMVDDYGMDAFDRLKGGLRAFQLGEEAVTDDLAPLAMGIPQIEDQMFITTHLYEEAKHTYHFDRYWREVIHEVEDELGIERTYPTNLEEGYTTQEYIDNYSELFERTEAAVEKCATDQSPETVAKAICHYHLVIEGIAAQSGYFAMHSLYGDNDAVPEMPYLPGLTEGFDNIRADEGRHVGYGMYKLKKYVSEGEVEPALIQDTVMELVEIVKGIVAPEEDHYEHIPGLAPEIVEEYATEKHMERMQQIVDAGEDIPGIEELTNVEVAGD
ncbi:MAG: ribonucleotide-diphosphate reductase subunit beta [Halobacteriales archaeon]|nr:ribonucleotide-diphosphate reductase subunit beta [Halobacteriales archaeon]